jgi:hypothetical protein
MIEFLFSNPIIIIILIGVISSLLKKKSKPNQQKSGQPQAQKPVWQEVVREIEEEWREEKHKIPKTMQEAKSVLADKDAERKRVEELKRLQKEYEEQQIREVEAKPDSSAVFPMPDQVKGTPVASMNTISDKRSPIYNNQPSFGKQELINGIIMSEILGPPRAKRSEKQSRQ